MKFIKIISFLTFCSITFNALAFNELKTQTTESYQQTHSIEIPEIEIPTLVEFNYDIQKHSILILDEDRQPVGFQENTLYESNNFEITSSPKTQKLDSLIDGKFKTSAKFKVQKDTQTTSLNFESQEKHKYQSVNIDYNYLSKTADFIKITTSINGKQEVVVARTKASTDSIQFPLTLTNNFQITLEHSQPLEVNEIVFKRSTIAQAFSNQYTFLAVPDSNYTIFTDADRNPNYLIPEAGTYSTDATVLTSTLTNTQPNSLYKPKDTDQDGVLDNIDNCRNLANADQADVNENSIGDACEDFDGDGVLNGEDNCPNQANSNQADQDNDKIGDTCDNQEDRITERLPWIQWVALGITAAIIIFLAVKKD